MRNKRFQEIREEIRKKRQSSGELWNYEIGRMREQRTTAVLQKMKDEGLIRDFLPTGALSFPDIVEGIDFFVVCVGSAYIFRPLSVTGERWIRKHRDQHPEVPVIGVGVFEALDSIKNKIMEAINK